MRLKFTFTLGNSLKSGAHFRCQRRRCVARAIGQRANLLQRIVKQNHPRSQRHQYRIIAVDQRTEFRIMAQNGKNLVGNVTPITGTCISIPASPRLHQTICGIRRPQNFGQQVADRFKPRSRTH